MDIHSFSSIFSGDEQTSFEEMIYWILILNLDQSPCRFGIRVWGTVTSRESLIRTFSRRFLRLWVQMYQQTTSTLLSIQKRRWPSSFPSLSWSSRTWRNISHLRCRCSMTRASGEDSVLQTISRPLVWNPSFAQCLWDWMRVGTRFSSTCQISLGERTVPTT